MINRAKRSFCTFHHSTNGGEAARFAVNGDGHPRPDALRYSDRRGGKSGALRDFVGPGW